MLENFGKKVVLAIIDLNFVKKMEDKMRACIEKAETLTEEERAQLMKDLEKKYAVK